MPFDGSEHEWRRSDPKRSGSDDTVVTVIIIAVAAALLAMPLTLGSLASLARYLHQPHAVHHN